MHRDTKSAHQTEQLSKPSRFMNQFARRWEISSAEGPALQPVLGVLGWMHAIPTMA